MLAPLLDQHGRVIRIIAAQTREAASTPHQLVKTLEAAEQGSQQRGGSGTWPLSLLRGRERQHERNREEGASLAMRFGRAHRSHVV